MEANVREIVEIMAWTPAGARRADRLQLYNFHNYNFDAAEGALVSYRLFTAFRDEAGNIGYDPGGRELKEIVAEGTVAVPDEIVQSWGADDEVIFDHVIAALGLERA